VCSPVISHLCYYNLYHISCNRLICSSNHCHLMPAVYGVQATVVFGIFICPHLIISFWVNGLQEWKYVVSQNNL
jgi:hypothetical protein